MKVSIVTVAYNSEATIADTLRSVAAQSYRDIEHIVIDGASRDGTLSIIDAHRSQLAQAVSEPDRGIYDAMNKGLRLATGDVVGFLNSDDYYAHDTAIETIVRAFAQPGIDAVFADARFIDPDRPGKVIRRYSSRRFHPGRIAWGWMPAHPTLYLRRAVYERYGGYRTDFRIAGDFEFIARVFGHHDIRYRYLPEVLVTMRTGGISTSGLRGTMLLNREVLRACRLNRIPTNYFKIGSKYLLKLLEFGPGKRI